MIEKIKGWLKGKLTKSTYPRTVRPMAAGFQGSPRVTQKLVVPITKGFELEGLGALGQDQSQSENKGKQIF